MIAEKMKEYVHNSSAVRAMFEEGKKMAVIYGSDNVYDFSLGNPNVETPEAVKKAIYRILEEEQSTVVHGYMNNSGYEEIRKKIADSINKKQGTCFSSENILMTVGAAGGLNVIFKTLLNPEDQVITFAPYFSEYKNYAANYDARLITISPNTKTFQPNIKELEEKITKKTKAIIINSPNNPTGVIYSEETIIKIAEVLEKKQKEFEQDIYIISDEPYRELVYDNIQVPYITKYYKNTIIGYSYSKSLSLPGERIGYLVIPDEVSDSKNIIAGANVANRILGFVNAPSLFQKVIGECLEEEVDISYYKNNRDTLYEGLTSTGYECARPEGAFYLFLKSPIADEKIFCEAAKKHRILIVPGGAFGCPGYIRIAYCVSYETIVNALPGFLALAQEFN
jgi:Aspartate/tyrosine/aromatic aminotransferase